MIALKTPEIPDAYIKPIREVLATEWFENVRLATFGLFAAWAAYCSLLIYVAGYQKYLWMMLAQWGFGCLTISYLFIGPRLFATPRVQLLLGNSIIGLTLFTAGMGFYYQLPALTSPGLQITAYCLAVGVLGAAAFTFAANKFSFLIFAAGWAGPLEFYLVFESPDFGYRVLAFTQVIYVAVLYLIGLMSYNRRVQMVINELNLQKSYEMITGLKTQQDADYYLTSLLLQPLSVNKTQPTGPVRVAFLTDQYKKFKFRNRENAIGGDFSSAHTVRLRSGDCTVFVNADAMGKSMQGAGGALVFGAVFELIIERTRMKSEYRNMYPERWLKSAFIELYKVFEGFEGTMMVSAFMGIVENQSGLMYFINSEHPAAVVYRKGKADFVPDENMQRKLGTPGFLRSVTISTFSLNEGDTIILGSDGRDDIYLSDTVKKTMNEDEHLFLRNVEKADGDLQRLYEVTRTCGELKDDISLVSIAFVPAAQTQARSQDLRDYLSNATGEIYRAIKTGNLGIATAALTGLASIRITDSHALRVLIKLAFKAKIYSLAIRWSEDYQRMSQDVEMIYIASLAHKKLQNYESAADLFERLRLRGTNDEKVFSHLSDVYIKMGNKERGLEIMNEFRAGEK